MKKNFQFNTRQIKRYSHHIALGDIGGNGQKKLLGAKILIVGAGGLGSPLILYLAATGIGNMGIIDDDKVTISNLQRQIIYETKDLNKFKADVAFRKIKALNPDIKIKKYKYRLGKNNIYSLLNQYDIVADGSDNFSTRYLLNEACFLKKKILVSAAINKFEGQLTTFKPFLNKRSINSKHPCYRCIYPSHEKHLNTNCSDDGVFSILAGIVGSMQANEVVKEYLSIGKSLSGKLVIFNALTFEMKKISISPNRYCKTCSRLNGK